MRTSLCCLALALFLVAPSAHADEASARAKLAEDQVAFTPEAFLDAVASGNVEHVELFLDGGIDPAVKNPQSQTALWLAVEHEHLAVLQALLARGVAPNETNAPVGGDARDARAAGERGVGRRSLPPQRHQRRHPLPPSSPAPPALGP